MRCNECGGPLGPHLYCPRCDPPLLLILFLLVAAGVVTAVWLLLV
jgi:hypothetical protein